MISIKTEESGANALCETDEYGTNALSETNHESQEYAMKCIDAMSSASLFICPIGLQADDQIVLPGTCTEKDQDHRLTAVQRVRDDEDEAILKKTVERNRKR